MRIVFFSKPDCEACRKAKDKVGFFLNKWGIADSVETETIDLSTSDGLVEAAMRAVADIPTVILEDVGGEVARWIKRPPSSQELRERLGV
jgi:hypothetical protein